MRTQAIVAWVVFTLAAAPVLADMPPPDGYVEACTIAKKKAATSECLECRGWYGNVNWCTNLLAPYCYTKLCNTYGASVWTEVFCRTKDAKAPVVPSDTLSIITSPGGDPAVDGGVAAIPSTCAPYTPSTTDTTTGTETSTSTSKDSSGCSVTTEGAGLRALVPVMLVLAGLALVLLRRRPRQ
jgi:MYXO-CTERM domain-containing protein